MTFGVQVSFYILVFSGSTPRYGIAGSLGTSMLSFLRTTILSLVGVLIYTPTNSVGGFPSLLSLCRIDCCRIFDMATLINVR